VRPCPNKPKKEGKKKREEGGREGRKEGRREGREGREERNLVQGYLYSLIFNFHICKMGIL
jgi:hypothetical protein